MATRRNLQPLARPLRSPASPPRPPPPSTVALGTAYERATASFLAQAPQYTLQGIVRVGGKGDQGIDLRARWHLASSPSSHPLPYPVIVQCKAESSPVGPATVRELEGTLAAQHPSPSSPSTAPSVPHIALLVALSGFTEAAIRHARSSTRPLALLHLEPVPVPGTGAGGDEAPHDWVRARAGTVTTRLVSASWNRALEGLVARAREGEGEERRAGRGRGGRDGEDGPGRAG
ncbi:hypothetical protein JCM9279_007708 [Rhodotorula babjevae]